MTVLAFLFAALILAVTPGPGLAYVVARTVSGGRSEGLASSLGTAIGGLFHVGAAALGISVLVAQSAFAFSLVKYVGAAYLVYLGIRTLRQKQDGFVVQEVASAGVSRAFRQGVVVEILNVKTALFFLAFLPQFTTTNSPIAMQLALLGGVCVVLNTTMDLVAVYATDRLLQSKLGRASGARVLTRLSGFTMLMLGTFLAFARRNA
ncbi:LysE family translocator [Comamonas sp.]|uniref:LysE family translocator n=1 Tax=Comamonas sp. TaxID=34028 RepID=UPI00289E8C87|nr:LysE family translocator [Comamonas sp.]